MKRTTVGITVMALCISLALMPADDDLDEHGVFVHPPMEGR